MLARLLLFLLALAFAAPAATAACHAGGSGHHAAAPSHHGTTPVKQHDEGFAPATACIGCVPPSNWTPGRIGAFTPVPAVPVSGYIHMLTIGRGTPPALPPPRTR